MAMEEATQSTDDGMLYRSGAIELLGRSLTVWYRGLSRFIILFGLGMMSLSFVISALLSYIFLNPELIYFTSFDGFGFVLRIPAYSDLIIFNVIVLLFSTVIMGIIEAPTTKFTLDLYEQNTPEVDKAIVESKPKIGAFIRFRLIVILIELAFILPILFILLFGYSIGDLNLIITGETMSLMLVFIVGYIHVRFIPAAPIILRENLSIRDAIQRCFDLTSGQFMHIAIGFLGLVFFEFMIFFFIVNIFSIFGTSYIAILLPFNVSLLLFAVLRPIFSVVVYRDLLSRVK